MLWFLVYQNNNNIYLETPVLGTWLNDFTHVRVERQTS